MDAEDFKGKTALIVDDDENIQQLLSIVFKPTGIGIKHAYTGRQGLSQWRQDMPHVIFLDLMLPDVDGWEVCHQIRQESTVPIIVLSSLHQDSAIVRALDAGADDYVVKPFNRRILLSRTNAILRRMSLNQPGTEPIYDDGYLQVNLESHQILVGGERVKLSATEMRLFEYLFNHAGLIRTFSQILSNVWGEQYYDSAEYVHVYIWHLRQKLERNPRDPVYLITEHSIGYRFQKHPGADSRGFNGIT